MLANHDYKCLDSMGSLSIQLDRPGSHISTRLEWEIIRTKH